MKKINETLVLRNFALPGGPAAETRWDVSQCALWLSALALVTEGDSDLSVGAKGAIRARFKR